MNGMVIIRDPQGWSERVEKAQHEFAGANCLELLAANKPPKCDTPQVNRHVGRPSPGRCNIAR